MSALRTTVGVLLVALALALAVYAGVSDFMPTVAGGRQEAPALLVVPAAVFIWITPILGGLLIARRPSNPVGWLFVTMSLGWSAGFASDDLARHAAASPFVSGLVTIGQQVGGIGYVSLFLLLMVFPTGTVPGPRWRALPVITIAASAAAITAGILTPGTPVDPPVPGVENPFAQPALAPIVGVLTTASQLGFLVGAIAAIVLLGLRVRRSAGIERQQLKWFVSAGALTATLFAVVIVVDVVAPATPLAAAVWSLPLASVVLLPITAAIAILRYRLYDIDRIISRTLSWAVVSAALIAVFVAGVVALQAALSGFTQGETLAVAGSTLLAFALFQPLRVRVQRAIDRRFDRTRYDRERTTTAFATRLRDEFDVEAVATDLGRTAARTVAPSVLSVWIRPPRTGRERPAVRNEFRTTEA